MNIRKTHVGYGLAILVSALLLAGIALARDFGHRPPPPGPEGILGRIDQDVKTLGLNSTQQKTYQELRARLAADLSADQAARKEFALAMKAELNKDEPDWKLLSELVSAHTQAMSQDMNDKFSLVVEFHNILDAQQQKALRETLIARLDGPPRR